MSDADKELNLPEEAITNITDYDANQITVLEGLEAVRMRPKYVYRRYQFPRPSSSGI